MPNTLPPASPPPARLPGGGDDYLLDRENLPYDPADKHSIIAHARRLVGHSLASACADTTQLAAFTKNRGSLGTALETVWFGLKNNSSPLPDFREAGLELKSTALIQGANGTLRAKERLVLAMINFFDLLSETPQDNILTKKALHLLLLGYLYKREQNPLHAIFLLADEITIPDQDLPQLLADWQTIYDKVKDGRAHEISCGDTMYLEACPKGSSKRDTTAQPAGPPAMRRAWAFRSSYLTSLLRQNFDLEEIERAIGEKDLGLRELITGKFAPYLGRSQSDLAEHFGLRRPDTPRAKGETAAITRRILGVEDLRKVSEFEKAGITVRTIRLIDTGRPKEAVSFPAFDWNEVRHTPFAKSDFCAALQSKFLFIIYQVDPNGTDFILRDTLLWQMPEADLEHAQACYDLLRRRLDTIPIGDPVVKSSENPCCHVRPHAKNSDDKLAYLDIYGQTHLLKRKSFWLNQGYLAAQIARLTQP